MAGSARTTHPALPGHWRQAQILLALACLCAVASAGCSWHGLPYEMDICTLLYHNRTGALPPARMLPAVQSAVLRAANRTNTPIQTGSKPLECVGCIVGLTFGELTAANFGAAAEACRLCSCKNLTQPQCTNAIDDALYAVIAAMPALAVSVFEGCKSLCVN